MRYPGVPEDARGQQLVVGGRERRAGVQDFDAGGGEALQVGLAFLHAVERLADVEPPQRDVARLEEAKGVARRNHLGRQSERR
jgi:hypothetical protein